MFKVVISKEVSTPEDKYAKYDEIYSQLFEEVELSKIIIALNSKE